MIDTVFLEQVKGGSEFFNNGGRFLQRGRVLWGGLAGPQDSVCRAAHGKYSWSVNYYDFCQIRPITL